MAKSLEEIKKALEALPDGKDYIEGFDAALDARGVEASRKANKEAEKLRDRAKVAEANLKAVADGLGVDLSGDDIADKIDEIVKSKSSTKPVDDPETKSRLKKLEEQLAASLDREKAIAARSETNLKRSVLTDLLSKANVSKEVLADYVELLMSKTKVVDGEKVRAMKGEEEITVEDFVTEYVKSKPGIVSNPAQPGAGAKSGGQQSGPSKSPDTSMLSATDKMAAGFASKN